MGASEIILFDPSRSHALQAWYVAHLYQTYGLSKGLSGSNVRKLYEFLNQMVGNLLESLMYGRVLAVGITKCDLSLIGVHRVLDALTAEGLVTEIRRGYWFNEAKTQVTRVRCSHKLLAYIDLSSNTLSRSWASVVRCGGIEKTLKDRKDEHLLLQTCSKAFQTRTNVPIGQFRRIFSNSVESGGRVYSKYQHMPKVIRKYIMIDNERTIELDYPANQMRMILYLYGESDDMDPYSDLGIERQIAKRALNVMVNSRNPLRVYCDQRASGLFRWSREEAMLFMETVCKQMPIFKGLIGSMMGAKLQRVEGDIALRLMGDMIKHNEVALPIHDSFVVRSGMREVFGEMMKQAWYDVLFYERENWRFNEL